MSRLVAFLEIVQRASRGPPCASETGTVSFLSTLFSFALVQNPSWLHRENWRRGLPSTLSNFLNGTGGPRSGQKVSTRLAKNPASTFNPYPGRILRERKGEGANKENRQYRMRQEEVTTAPRKKRQKERRESRKKQGRSAVCHSREMQVAPQSTAGAPDVHVEEDIGYLAHRHISVSVPLAVLTHKAGRGPHTAAFRSRPSNRESGFLFR